MRIIAVILSLFWQPLRRNGTFFVFMYVLGVVCTYATLPAGKGVEPYSLVWAELFVDLYAVCLVLALIPRKVRVWLRRLLYVVAYVVAFADVWCFVKFDSTLTPTMLLLVGETNSQEASEFITSYLSADVVFSRAGRVLLVIIVHLAWSMATWAVSRNRMLSAVRLRRHPWAAPLYGMLTAGLLAWSVVLCYGNKEAMVRLFSYDNIGGVEHELTKKDRAVLYQPLYRLAFSIYANRLTSRQLVVLRERLDEVSVDSCTCRSPRIVLIIGESYNRKHSQLYGYSMPTTIYQQWWADRGYLVPLSDVVAPWNLTSFVFKHLFSLYAVGDEGSWCDYPLFPEVFRKAGYHVTFFTNQFLPQAKEAVYDFSGGFFLNDPVLSSAMFDTRNEQLYYFDEGLLTESDSTDAPSLTIYHLKGQHTDYRTRCPKSKQHFTRSDYNRPDLTARQLQQVVFYDNAVRYNDSIVNQIIRRYMHEDAIVIYVPDHGEECYDSELKMHGRLHSAQVTARLAHEEFDIPMWLYCSKAYIEARPEVYKAIVRAKDKPYMTDALPHMLLWLAGIGCPEYREELNLLSPHYDAGRKRILKGEADYDALTVGADSNRARDDLKTADR